jgi:hypothetical protein
MPGITGAAIDEDDASVAEDAAADAVGRSVTALQTCGGVKWDGRTGVGVGMVVVGAGRPDGEGDPIHPIDTKSSTCV